MTVHLMKICYTICLTTATPAAAPTAAPNAHPTVTCTAAPSLVVDAAAADRIDGTESATCEAWAAAATAEARREAAARLATRPAAVAGFARRCARIWASEAATM